MSDEKCPMCGYPRESTLHKGICERLKRTEDEFEKLLEDGDVLRLRALGVALE